MKTSENIEKPEELDFTSCHFNALRALYEPDENITLPKPEAPIYDNLSCFIETSDGIFPKERKQPTITPSTSIDAEESSKPETEETVRRKHKSHKNVLTRMDNCVNGPLTFLKKCMDENLRIKVYTRGPVNIRGFCLGFLDAFDKHWNLVLKDVFEIWTRRRRKRPVCGAEDEEHEESCVPCDSRNTGDSSKQLSQHEQRTLREIRNGDRPQNSDECRKPKIVVRKRLKRKEICERHIDQILIRGEQIVLVTLSSN